MDLQYTFICSICGETVEPVVAPDTVDLDVWCDMIEAHGAYHGTDWREAAAEARVTLDAFRIARALLDEL